MAGCDSYVCCTQSKFTKKKGWGRWAEKSQPKMLAQWHMATADEF